MRRFILYRRAKTDVFADREVKHDTVLENKTNLTVKMYLFVLSNIFSIIFNGAFGWFQEADEQV
jgi:hypothetical protein